MSDEIKPINISGSDDIASSPPIPYFPIKNIMPPLPAPSIFKDTEQVSNLNFNTQNQDISDDIFFYEDTHENEFQTHATRYSNTYLEEPNSTLLPKTNSLEYYGSYESLCNDNKVYGESETHRNSHLENYWCDFCAESLFMHNLSAKKYVDRIIKRNKLIDDNGNLINTDFFRSQKSDAHELGVILTLNMSCCEYVARKYKPVYIQYFRIISNNILSHEYISKGIVYQYNNKYYERKCIDYNDIETIRYYQLKCGLQCTKCLKLACPFHQNYSNFDMTRDVCGWCADLPPTYSSIFNTVISSDSDTESIVFKEYKYNRECIVYNCDCDDDDFYDCE